MKTYAEIEALNLGAVEVVVDGGEELSCVEIKVPDFRILRNYLSRFDSVLNNHADRRMHEPDCSENLMDTWH